MNLFDALNEGDASLKEPHITSVLYYLFIKTYESNKGNSLIKYFLKFNLGIELENYIEIDIEKDIKIEQIISFNNIRKDCDITIFLRNEKENLIINIENKISINAFQQNQVNEQSRILKNIYEDYIVKNILIMPYESIRTISNNEVHDDVKYLYWHGIENSLIQQINNYFTVLHYQNSELKNTIDAFKSFFNAYGNNLEQIKQSSEIMERGPKNKLIKTMFEYLKEISEKWESIFKEKSEEITVRDLIEKFTENVVIDINNNNSKDESIEMIKKFKRGAMEAQPKIMTINEKNRIHFSITEPNSKKNLFYYPDFPDGNYDIRWKDLRIKPLKNLTKDNQYIIFYKDKSNNEVRTSKYKK